MSDPTKWTSVATGGLIDPTAAGNVDPGEAVINRAGMCGFGGLSQTFTMPPLARAEPMKLVVTHTAVDASRDLFGVVLSIGVGQQWMDLPLSVGAYKTESFCLGPAAFGGPTEFRIATMGSPICTGASTSTVRVDQMQVQLAAPGECPMPGQVINGDFESAMGWTFNNVSSATGAIVPAAGEAGSAAAQIAGANKCSEATMIGTASFPAKAAMANPAIDMFWNGTAGQRLVVGIAGKNVETLNANGVAKHSRLCIPPWAAGTVNSLSFFMQRQSDNGCTTALARSFTIDNVTIVNEPACNTAGELTDAGFERVANLTGPVTGWGVTNGYVNDVEGLTATVLNSPGLAHTGNGVLRVSWINQCTDVNSGGADFTTFVPPAVGTAGPAVKFFVNAPATNTMTESRLAMQPQANSTTPVFVTSPETGAYVQNILCLPPQLIKRRITLHASTGIVGGGGCLQNQPQEAALFDDFDVTTDPSCPAM
jgi:hypothetical protein